MLDKIMCNFKISSLLTPVIFAKEMASVNTRREVLPSLDVPDPPDFG